MAIPDVADQYFTLESRIASFQTAQQLSKRRASNASSKAPKSLKWPHKFLSAEEVAKAGFFYYPTQSNPDNVGCFLCHKGLDGWEEDDDPLVEHLKHSPDCGWAISATIEKQDGDLTQEYPMSVRMIEARKATFADKWPHEGKKGWKCKVKQMVDSGWKYTPTMESDDMATCTYCSLALDGWEPSDKPMDEHFKRSPECPFFTLINNHKQSPAAKRTKAKRDRASKASRLSTQSAFTVASDAPSITDLPAEDEDSSLTTTTTATASQGKKMGKPKKATATKGRKTRAKKAEPVEVLGQEPEDADFEVKVDQEPKPTRGRKRKSEQDHHTAVPAMDIEAPPPKRRATRTRGSMAVDESIIDSAENIQPDASKPLGRKGRASAKSSRKASVASMASLRAPFIDDNEIDQALEADLERHLSDEEETPITAPAKKTSRSSKVTKADHAMFGLNAVEVDSAAIEAELEAMDVDSKPLPKAKGGKGKQARKPSARQQAAAKKVADAEAESQRLAEENEASQQIVTELEHSISIQHSSPIIQQKKRNASSRPAGSQMPGRPTRGSVLSTSDRISIIGDYQESIDVHEDDYGDESDASMASQSTVIRGGTSRRGSTMKKGRGGKMATSRNIEEIVQEPPKAPFPSTEVAEKIPSAKSKKIIHREEISMVEDVFYTPVPEFPQPAPKGPGPKAAKVKAAKPRGRPPKAGPEPSSQQSATVVDPIRAEEARVQSTVAQPKTQLTPAPRSPTPAPMEATPSQSPQSSDAENHPPSSKPSAATKKTATPHSTAKRIPLAATTPSMSPSKRNVIAGLQSLHPWTAVDLETVFMKSPSGENGIANVADIFGGAVEQIRSGELTSPEKKMTVEEWIRHNAQMAEEKLKNECERMVGTFESQGTRAMCALEGVECVE